MDQVSSEVRCKDCGILLDEDKTTKLEDRRPCPQCGSKVRIVTMSVETKITISDSIAAKAKSPGIKRPTLETFSGSEMYQKENKPVHKERVIDRKHDLYREKVVDPQTGEIIHEKEEPLSKHHGHGDAKHKK